MTSLRIAMVLEMTQSIAEIPSYSMSLKIAIVQTVTGILHFTANPRILKLQRSSVSLKTERSQMAADHLTVTS